MHEAVVFHPRKMPGIIDLRSLGYYKMKQGVLWQTLSCMYHFESVNEVCNQFNRLINTQKKRKRKKLAIQTSIHGWMIVMREIP